MAGRTEITVVREQNASPQKSGEAVNSLRARAGSGKAMQRPPFAKLSVLGMCVSVLAALFLAAVPDFQPNIVLFPQRVALFALRYTMPICFLPAVGCVLDPLLYREAVIRSRQMRPLAKANHK